MRRRLTKLAAALAALAALAIGGSALASASGGGSQPAKSPVVIQQQGSAKAGAVANQPAEQADTDSIQDENGKDDATEQADTEQDEGSEKAESGSEVPGDDGPGGHADEPGNPDADHQFEGQE